jgi:hypothetical protein
MNRLLTFQLPNTHQRIYIQTANSIYTFTLLDTHMQRGSLTGGALGAQEVEAYAVSVINSRHGQVARRLSKSIEGFQIIFLVFVGKVPEYLITSVVTGLVYEDEPGMCPSAPFSRSGELNDCQKIA